MTCKLTHASWDVPPEKWRCPACRADADKFYVSHPVSEDCEVLHSADHCCCQGCGYEGSGAQVAVALRKKEKPDQDIAYLRYLLSGAPNKTDEKALKKIIKRLERQP